MAASESRLWEQMRDAVSGHWVRIENLCEPGTPDTSFAFEWEPGLEFEGWMELKNLTEWPKRARTKVDCGVTIDQVRWGARRAGAGGLWLLGVGTPENELLLFIGLTAARVAGKQFTRAELLREAFWRGPPEEVERGIVEVMK